MERTSASAISLEVCENYGSRAQHTRVNIWKTDADCITHTRSSEKRLEESKWLKSQQVNASKTDANSISHSASSRSGSDSRGDSDDDLQVWGLSRTVVTSLMAMLLIVLLNGGVDVWDCP